PRPPSQQVPPAPRPAPAPTPTEDQTATRAARELRPDRGDEGNQISVQELLRRSRARQSDQD
ncbi:MAG: hypothetical protein LBE07_09025, partial [Gordonia sp. (in: high G+C Gram-positive bacteria)]|nr:hypothetical protein [Gordonia sp. (in: high G+C Gram-positive bacteria)]